MKFVALQYFKCGVIFITAMRSSTDCSNLLGNFLYLAKLCGIICGIRVISNWLENPAFIQHALAYFCPN